MNMDEEYVNNQVVRFHSNEADVPVWSEGQLYFLNNFAKKYVAGAVLELGCGNGVGLEWLSGSPEVTSITGVDLSLVKLARCPTNVRALMCDMHNLPQEFENSFDVVLSSHALEHAHSPVVVLRGIHKVLKEHGVLVFVVPFPDGGDDRAHPGKYALKTDIASAANLSTEGIQEVVTSMGFEVLASSLSSVREAEVWIAARKKV